MRKTIAIAFLTLLTASTVSAQVKSSVELKNGQSFTGVLVEENDLIIRLQLADGNRRIFYKEDVTSIQHTSVEQVNVAEIEKRKQQKPIYTKTKRGFESIFDISLGIIEFNRHGNCRRLSWVPNTGLTYIAGYRFNNLFYLGAGIGVNFNTKSRYQYGNDHLAEHVLLTNLYHEHDNTDYHLNSNCYPFLRQSFVSVPLFAYFRVNIINNRYSPFMALAAGGNITTNQNVDLPAAEAKYNTSTMFFNPQIGVSFRTTLKTSIYFAFGFNGFSIPVWTSHSNYAAYYKMTFAYSFDMHCGVTF